MIPQSVAEDALLKTCECFYSPDNHLFTEHLYNFTDHKFYNESLIFVTMIFLHSSHRTQLTFILQLQ
jgi:hypothetical protein